jgi:phospholipase C
VTVAGTDGSSYTVQLTNGSGTQAVSPAVTTTYTVTATGAAGTTPATATAIVTVVAAPPPPPAPTVTLTASPTTINTGGSSTLTVTATNATNLVIAGSDGTAPTVPVTGGTVSVSPKLTTTYTVTATNATGEVSATATVTVNQGTTPTITSFTASPSSIAVGGSSTLTVVTTGATSVAITGTDGTNQSISIDTTNTGILSVKPGSTATYTATANGAGGASQPATATVTVVPAGSIQSISHVIFMLQENHSFDDYFGMLNTYRKNNGYNMGTDGTEYDVDGIEDKVNGQSYAAVRGATVISNKDKSGGAHPLFPLKSTCLDDMSSAWSESFGAVSLGNYLTTRPIRMQGFADNGDGFANSKCPGGVGPCTGYTDTTGDRTMGYYDESFLNYYYYMASQFALSDRWFSPIESKSIPNRIATFTGGTTQGLVKDPSQDDHLGALTINNIFQELDQAGVSWKVYYTVTNAECDPEDCKPGSSLLPATTFSYLTYSFKYVGGKPTDPGGCTSPKQPDSSNSFCIDPNHMASVNDPTNGYFADLKNGKLPSFAFIESGSGKNDEHPGYQQSVLVGQAYVATLINGLMASTSWPESVFFLAYDEGGGPYDHVPPTPGHANDFTDTTAAANYPTDVSGISVQPDKFYPCVPAAAGDMHCDLSAGQPGSNPGDIAGPPTNTPAGSGFGAQVGFRVPDMVVSPFVKKHYVSHVPMDHTAVIKFVEDRFIGNGKYLTARDAAQPNLLDFFDFTSIPWLTPPTPPTPIAVGGSCKPTAFH